jgi:uncharacterized protein (DUF1810 family)
MTLFMHAASDNSLFEAALRKYFGGEADSVTLGKLGLVHAPLGGRA